VKRILVLGLILLIAAACGGRRASDSEDSFAHHYNLGLAAFEQGNYRQAVRHFQRSLELNPNIARTHNELGMCYLNLGEHERAIQHFERTLELEPNFADAHNSLGIAYSNTGRLQEAEQQFLAALDSTTYGTDFLPNYNLGNIYLQQGEHERALERFNFALEDESRVTQEDKINLRLGLGYTLLHLERYREALDHFEEVLTLSPRNVNAAFFGGRCAFYVGNADRARELFSRVITNAPGTEWSERAQAYLRELDR